MTHGAGQNDMDLLMDKLSAYPEALSASVMQFRKTPSIDTAATIVTEILRYHQSDNFDALYAEKGEQLRLFDDLGMDSLTMTEIAFEAEDFLDISISNEDMLEIKTVQDLKAYVTRSIS